MKYKHVFFDLDLTLWDFDKNSTEALFEIFNELELTNSGVTNFDEFVAGYKIHNEAMWEGYRKGIVTKEQLRTERFDKALLDFGIQDKKLAQKIGDAYLEKSPFKTHLLPYTIEVLEYLSQKYTLHIITNGFKEVQFLKLENTGIRKFFDQVITSESAGFKKPDKRIFHYSLYRAKAKTKQSIMIGDHLDIDVVGARNAGLDQVYFNPGCKVHKQKVTYEVSSLKTLIEIF
ncbi:MAG: noncanonical pyrimidine nucleotidase, YjjG family [Bacteroidetes bacterium]|nr:noncanonical pyrimidine nucleotidase, YjjG family [Bacteroidota bacterium]HET6243968.1 YjjG family noncanonical pyrimidine nucleotidase [Bacteroidia bacterium]